MAKHGYIPFPLICGGVGLYKPEGGGLMPTPKRPREDDTLLGPSDVGGKGHDPFIMKGSEGDRIPGPFFMGGGHGKYVPDPFIWGGSGGVIGGG